MEKNFKWLLPLIILLIFVLFLIPFSFVSTDVSKYKKDTDIKLELLNNKIDSLENELKIKKDTLIIKPIKIEIYESRKS